MNRREFLATGAALPLVGLPATGAAVTEQAEPWHPFRSREGINNALVYTSSGFYLPWDFNYAFGDTIKEKYQTLLGIVDAACHILYSRFDNNSEWKRLNCNSCSLLTGPEVTSVLECSQITLESIRDGNWPFQRVTHYDNNNITRLGFLNDTLPVDFYKSLNFPSDRILVRANVPTDPVSESMFNGLNYVPIHLKNFIW